MAAVEPNGANAARREDVTRLLQESMGGDAESTEKLFELIYNDLKSRAHGFMRREHQTITLQTTALVHEAYVSMAAQRAGWKDRNQFLVIAAMAMRRILVDQARAKAAKKRGRRPEQVPLDEGMLQWSPIQAEELLDLHEALTALGRRLPRAARVIELRFFGGMSEREVAAILDVNIKTVQRDWLFARTWLNARMDGNLHD